MTLQKLILSILVLLSSVSFPALAMAPSYYNDDVVKFHVANIGDFKVRESIIRTIKYKDMVVKALIEEGVDTTTEEVSEILGQIVHESGGNPNAIGSSGEIGLMQLMPGTARLMRVNPRTVYGNILGGVRYRQHLRIDYGLEGETLLAAYNAGPARSWKCGKCQKYIRAVAQWARIFKSILTDEKVG